MKASTTVARGRMIQQVDGGDAFEPRSSFLQNSLIRTENESGFKLRLEFSWDAAVVVSFLRTIRYDRLVVADVGAKNYKILWQRASARRVTDGAKILLI